MLRVPLWSTTSLVNQLGFKNFQSKLCPLLYTGSLCAQDERRYLYSTPKNQLLQPKILIRPDHCIFHTSSSKFDKSLASPKSIIHDFRREAGKVFKAVDFKDIKNAPKAVQSLGFSGLIPFVLPPLAIIMNGEFLPNLAFAQLTYGCTILAFLGGVKWGFTLPAGSTDQPTYKNLCISITWPLVAWGAMLLPESLGTLTLMGGMAVAVYHDTLMSSYPAWFKALRVCLSSVAIASLFLMLILRLLL